MPKKLTQDQFITQVIAKYGDLYDLSEALYVNSSTKVKFTCTQHQLAFWQTPNKLFTRSPGCRPCVKESIRANRASTTAEFIAKATLLHGIDRYDYSKVEYVTAHIPVIIGCNVCGLYFEQTPNAHLSAGHGCLYCSGRKYLNTSTFIKKATEVHGNKFDYSLTVYLDNETKVEIICNGCHKSFLQMPSGHLQEQGCPWCCKSPRTDTTIFIKKATGVHGDKYEYSSVDYKTAHTKVSIHCKECAIDFWQTPTSHLNGNGCPICPSRFSRAENEWLDMIGINIEYRRSIIMIDGKTVKVDALDLATNTIYEFYGDYWHGNPQVYDPQKSHPHNGKTFGQLHQSTLTREALIKQAGYNLVSIWESDWKLLKKETAA